MAVHAKEVSAPGKPSFWNDPRVRALFFQALVLGGVIALGIVVVNNTLANLERQGIASGFGFLERTAGFSISMSLIPYDEANTYGRAFVVGLLNTILVSFVGIALATVVGFIVGIMRLSKNWLIAKIAAAYIEILRNIPLLLQLFFWYFGILRQLPAPRNSVQVFDTFFLNIRGLYMPDPLPQPGFWWIPGAFGLAIVASILLRRWAKQRQLATGEQLPVLWPSLAMLIGLPVLASLITGFPLRWDYPVLQGFNFAGGIQLIPEFVALLLALSIYTAAFIAEIVRSGILSVSKGQTEAAYALGLRPNLTLRLVIIPQAMRVIIPPLTSQYLNLTKNSSLAAAIAYPDLVLVFAGTVLMQTGQAVEIIAITMGVYLTLSLLISGFMNWYNKKMALVER
ncbi:MAG: amino acid ABC transporter permease [Gammaproteobacteria bacterium]|nr:amino acid ABC transporter permease [Gammaproteobacteria bacterium]NIR83626.1 amino acid ABC transporter permease [Gammaproteobacteria bacterium]NIR91599.1 amino acid ABC transporter permease [Gammaproteobacteria bacterium]NIU04788.1 amino acid ABC transporter permease [Gammaproteobacteria bacterium]NIV53138.1 ABC transporter permease subunit [Gammaproteobacteria bacterium]